MSLVQTVNEGVLVLRLTGEVLDELALSVRRGPEGFSHPEIRLDLGAVRRPTAEGLRAVIHLHKDLRNRGGRLVLFNVADEVHEVLRVTGLVKVLDVRGAASPCPGR